VAVAKLRFVVPGVTGVRRHDVVQDEVARSSQLSFERPDVVAHVVVVVATKTAQTTLKNARWRNLFTDKTIAYSHFSI
jgi:hypothetical protein